MDIYRLCLYLGFTGIASMAVLGLGALSHGGHSHGNTGHGHGGHGHAEHGPGGHSHGGHGHSGHGHAGHGHAGHGHAGAHGHSPGGVTHTVHGHVASGHREAAPAHAGPHRGAGSQKTDRIGWVFGILSPRVFFSFLLGFGATGIVLKQLVPEAALVDWLGTLGWIGDPGLVYRGGRFLLAAAGGWAFEHFVVASIWNFIFRFASNPARTLETAVCEEARAVTNFDASGSGLIAIDLDGQVMQVLGTLTARERADGTHIRAGDLLFIEDVDATRNSCTVSVLERKSAPVS